MNDTSAIIQLLQPLIDLAAENKWLPFSAALIYLLVRVLKSEWMFWPLNKLPAKMRTMAAVVLGFAAAAVQSIAGGAPIRQTITTNLLAALTAITFHDTVVEWLRGGKETFSKPKDGAAPGDGSGGTGAGVAGAAGTMLLIVLAFLVSGCGYGATACKIIDTAAPLAQQGCTVLRYMGADGQVHEVPMAPEELQALGRSAAARQGAPAPAQAPAGSSAAPCPSSSAQGKTGP